MTRIKKLGCLSVAVLGLSIVPVGCGGPDNEKTGDLGTDGKPIPVTGSAGPAPKDSSEAYKSTQQNLQQTKGYPKNK
jgi:hypothetical protein